MFKQTELIYVELYVWTEQLICVELDVVNKTADLCWTINVRTKQLVGDKSWCLNETDNLWRMSTFEFYVHVPFLLPLSLLMRPALIHHLEKRGIQVSEECIVRFDLPVLVVPMSTCVFVCVCVCRPTCVSGADVYLFFFFFRWVIIGR